MMIAVLTGDIVNSTKMPQQQYKNVIQSLQALLKQTEAQYQACGEIYRGDEFQIQYPNPFDAIKSSLLIKLALISEDTKVPVQCTLSLAYGHYDIYAEKPNTSSGPVFVNSGRQLDKTNKGDLTVSFADKNQHDNIQLLTQFLNHVLNRLTNTQAALLYQYIQSDFAEHKKLAEQTGTTRQNISNRLANIGAHLVRDYIMLIQSYLTDSMDD
ncbi:hypothetical protein [Thalassotalea sediminis]|uniref:hypothetical protein n=1 Tax=Thalassotalea sediminis TaxID=1759089 RepID=UPI00257393D5|nr:hypothetical protein [Thalassotalea sediminis]